MDTAPGNTGIDIIGPMTWGMHGCLFYETQQDLLDILIPYFQAGLQNHEFCLYVAAKPVNAEEAGRSLHAAMPDFDQYLAEGQMEIIHFSEWLFTAGHFDFPKALKGFRDKRDQALAKGYAGLRFVGNPYPVPREHWDSFMEFERAVDGLIHDSQIVGMCTYALHRSSADDVLDIVQQHQIALARRNGIWEELAGAALRRAHERIRKLNAGLERRVVERTALLATTNEQLSREVAERTEAEEQIGREAARTDALLRVARAVNAELDLDQVIQTVCDETRRVLNVPISVLTLFDDQQQTFRFAGGSGFPLELVAELRLFRRADYDKLRPNGEVIVVVPDVQVESALPNPETYRTLNIRTWACVTLFLERGPIGTLSAETVGQIRTFDEDELKLLQGLADESALAIQNARLFQSVSEQRERLRVLSARLVQAQEVERRLIARQLHDEIGQALTAVKLNLQTLQRAAGEPASSRLGDSIAIVEETLERARGLSLELRPSMLDDLGLAAALRWYVDRQAQRAGLQARISAHLPDGRLPPRWKQPVFEWRR